MAGSEQFLTAPLGLGMLRQRTRVGSLRLCHSRRLCTLTARCQRTQARRRGGKKVILPWRGRKLNQFRRRPELRQQQRFLELLEETYGFPPSVLASSVSSSVSRTWKARLTALIRSPFAGDRLLMLGMRTKPSRLPAGQ